jgi:excisionase family DNA binding protein
MAIDEMNAMDLPATRLIKVDELAEMLGVSTRTLYRMVSAHKVPEPIRLGGCTRWRLDLVREWIEQGCPDLKGAT